MTSYQSAILSVVLYIYEDVHSGASARGQEVSHVYYYALAYERSPQCDIILYLTRKQRYCNIDCLLGYLLSIENLQPSLIKNLHQMLRESAGRIAYQLSTS